MKTVTPFKSRNGKATAEVAVPAPDLAAQVKADAAKRIEACGVELNEVCKRHGCHLAVEPFITINGQPVQIALKANPIA